MRDAIRGIVKDGQVVLDAPLDLPDGTVLTVTRCDHDDDPPPQEPTLKLTDEELAELTAFITRKKDKALWPEFEARLKEKYGPWLPHHRSSAA